MLNGEGVRRGPSPAVTIGTNILATAWAAAALHAALEHAALPRTHIAFGPFATIIVMVVAWAVMERKRWGRLALLGISVSVCASVNRWAGGEPHVGLVAAGVGPLFLLVTVLAALWFLRAATRNEFEYRKQSSTRMFQFGIAASLVLCWLIASC